MHKICEGLISRPLYPQLEVGLYIIKCRLEMQAGARWGCALYTSSVFFLSSED